MIAPLPAIAAHPDRIKRQDVVVLTQTIVTPDSTRTAIITLGNGGHTDAGPAATGAPNPPPSTGSSSGPSKDSGLSPTQIGIILGCCIGALVLLLILWFCLSRARFIRERIARDEDMRSWPSSSYTYPRPTRAPMTGCSPWTRHSPTAGVALVAIGPAASRAHLPRTAPKSTVAAERAGEDDPKTGMKDHDDEAVTSHVTLEENTPDEVETIIEFIYTGELTKGLYKREANVEAHVKIFELGDFFDLPALRTTALNALSERFDQYSDNWDPKKKLPWNRDIRHVVQVAYSNELATYEPLRKLLCDFVGRSRQFGQEILELAQLADPRGCRVGAVRKLRDLGNLVDLLGGSCALFPGNPF
ncbi:uncharacterized protein PG998_012177 [Apiospora kogelbergensis]|uniref:uncharacterized protein n=1 Tax=Apiospora kogelbergensis TaxID=1337665 RepID=UPI003130FC36